MVKNIVWFSELKNTDVGIAGGKGASLGEMYNIQLPIPPGFVVTAQAFKKFLDYTGLGKQIFSILRPLKADETEKIHDASEKIQEMVMDVKMPEEIKKDILESYEAMNVHVDVYKALSKTALSFVKAGRDQPFVAVRSSATAEDLPSASFAGQQKSFVNVKGNEILIMSAQDCWASLYTARAIYYRIKNGFAHEKVLIAVVVHKMVNSDASGVIFTINPATNNESEIMIEAGYGLGDAIVGGEITPDEYLVDKSSLKINGIKINKQLWCYTKDERYGRTIKKNLSESKASTQKITDEQIIGLAKYAKQIESHYGRAMDIEYAVENNKLFIVQARPVTTQKRVEGKREEQVSTSYGADVLLTGMGASPGVAKGRVKIIKDISDLRKIIKGDVMVANMTSPDMVPQMEMAVAIITNEGGITAHASIVSRELGIPCVVGTERATQVLKDGDLVTVDGYAGRIYRGEVEIKGEKPQEEIQLTESELHTKTKIYMNLSEPGLIDEYKDLPFDGIGLMRVEFIITDEIKKHPLYLIRQGKQHEYIEKLAAGIEKVASAVDNKPVIVRFSDFKTTEYSNLEGGNEFEPHENNPMIGWRGVSRYVSEEYVEAFKMECKAILKVRENCKNVHVMLPFVRKVEEVKRCLYIMKKEGLVRSRDLKIFLMGEVPSIAFIPEEFAKLDIDGVSIGSNDLTQLTMGVDRDSAKLGRMGYFDERDPAVLLAIKRIIEGFKKHGKITSICGQAPSTYKEIVEFLVENHIDDISVNPDTVKRTRKLVNEVEKSR